MILPRTCWARETITTRSRERASETKRQMKIWLAGSDKPVSSLSSPALPVKRKHVFEIPRVCGTVFARGLGVCSTYSSSEASSQTDEAMILPPSFCQDAIGRMMGAESCLNRAPIHIMPKKA